MSTSYFKKEYACTCGSDWGTCKGKGVFYLVENNSCDIGHILWQPHKGEDLIDVASLTDEQQHALGQLLTAGEACNEEDLKTIREFYDKKRL